MFVVYLPGYSKKNEEELKSFVACFKKNKIEFYAHRWNHWEHPEEENYEKFFEIEVPAIISALKEKDEIVFIGKSDGSRVAMKVIEEGGLSPQQIILMGLPLSKDREEKIKLYQRVLKKQNCPIVIIQNNHDPYSSPEEVRNALTDICCQLIIKELDTHVYNYSEDIVSLLAN